MNQKTILTLTVMIAVGMSLNYGALANEKSVGSPKPRILKVFPSKKGKRNISSHGERKTSMSAIKCNGNKNLPGKNTTGTPSNSKKSTAEIAI